VNRRHDWRISIDRVGLALVAGGAACGLVVAALVAGGANGSAAHVATALVLGTAFGVLAIGAIGGPVWLALHIAGRRGPVAAAATGAALGLILSLSAQSPSGTIVPPGMAGWLKIIGSSLIFAALGAAIASAMWRIAYRRRDVIRAGGSTGDARSRSDGDVPSAASANSAGQGQY
jgi:hypothetical protein